MFEIFPDNIVANLNVQGWQRDMNFLEVLQGGGFYMENKTQREFIIELHENLRNYAKSRFYRRHFSIQTTL